MRIKFIYWISIKLNSRTRMGDILQSRDYYFLCYISKTDEQAKASVKIITFKALEALLYSGTKFLQCPHHGAKNSTSQTSSPLVTSLSKLLGVSSTTSEEESYNPSAPDIHSKKPKIKLVGRYI